MSSACDKDTVPVDALSFRASAAISVLGRQSGICQLSICSTTPVRRVIQTAITCPLCRPTISP